METIEMTRHGFAPHHRPTRKFPQRSQSLRVKSSSPSHILRPLQHLRHNGTATTSSTSTRCPMPINRLIITNQDLIVQDISPASSTALSGCSSRTIQTTEPCLLQGKVKLTQALTCGTPPPPASHFTSMTLNRHRSKAADGRQRTEVDPTDAALTATSQSVSQTSTFFVNCFQSPNAIHKGTLDRNAQNDMAGHNDSSTSTGDNLNTCSTFSEDTGIEDEGAITPFTEDYFEESDDDDYLELEDVLHADYSQPRQVNLTRHPELGLGISIQGGSDFLAPVTVAAVRADTPADHCRLIFVGDQIISVNDVLLDDTTSHNDARRLLAECGDRVSLVLKHTRAVNSFRRKWRRRIVFNSSSSVEPIEPTLSAAGEVVPADCTDNKPMDKVDGTAGTSTASQSPSSPQPPQPPPSSSSALDSSHPWRPLGRSSSVATLGHCQRVDLFLAGITHYITYSDQLRDLSLEVHSADGNSLVIQCGHEEICEQWISAIKGTIDRLTDDFVSFFNKFYPQQEHIFYMGWLSEHECLSPLDSPHSRLVLQQLTSATSRWLSRFVIIKGGHVYLFKFPPVAILKAFKSRLAQSSRRNHSGSSGSSLGSVGSSTSDASTSSTGSAHFSLNAASTSSDLLMTKTRNSKLDKVEKANQDLEKDLLATSSHCFVTCKCDFRIVKPNELFDAKHFCFLLNTGAVTKRYFSTESEIDLQKLQAAWTRSNFYSVTKFKSKTFTVALEDENVFGSLILDWRFGFAFYNPKSKQYLWSYKFHQLKSSCDDGKSRLSMTFVSNPHDSRQVIKTHVLECSCLQVLLCCLHAFLSAKVYSLYI